jgi:hypothetical protein
MRWSRPAPPIAPDTRTLARRAGPQPLSRGNSSPAPAELVASGEASEKPTRTRWLANAEADHGGHDTAAEGGAREPGAGAAAAKAVTLADRDAGNGARPGKDGPRAGGGGHALRRSLRSLSRVRRQDPPATDPWPDGRARDDTASVRALDHDVP